MDILGIGPLELIVILLVALVVFGPDRLPTIGAKLGRAMRDMRKATREFSREIDAARRAIEGPVDEIKGPVQQIGGAVQGATAAAQALRNPGQALRAAVVRELSALPAADASPIPATATDLPPTPDAAAGETLTAETALPFPAAADAPAASETPAAEDRAPDQVAPAAATPTEER